MERSLDNNDLWRELARRKSTGKDRLLGIVSLAAIKANRKEKLSNIIIANSTQKVQTPLRMDRNLSTIAAHLLAKLSRLWLKELRVIIMPVIRLISLNQESWQGS
jgi:hypothetical protein